MCPLSAFMAGLLIQKIMHQPLGNFVLFLAFVSLTAAADQNFKTEYKAIGAEFVLKPPTVTPMIYNIEWQHDGNVAAFWDGGRTRCLGWFKGRCELDPLSGALTIRKLERSDSGVYTVTINHREITDTEFQLYVIAPVTKPTVSQICNTEMTSCNLTCNVKTQEEDHITYRWLADNAIGPKNEMFVITKEVEEVWFRCSVVNPVSDEISSDPVRNPFIPDLWIILGIGITILLVLGLLIILGLLYGYTHRWLKGRRCCGSPSINQRGWAEAGTDEETEMPLVSDETPNQDHASAASAQISKSAGNPAEELSCGEELKGLPVGDDDTRVRVEETSCEL